jgi:hypothetical protein
MRANEAAGVGRSAAVRVCGRKGIWWGGEVNGRGGERLATSPAFKGRPRRGRPPKIFFRNQREEAFAKSMSNYGQRAGTKNRRQNMIDIAAMKTTATRLRERALEIRREAEKTTYPTAGLDAALLEQAAALLEWAADELAKKA